MLVGVPLEVGGPPARVFISEWADQDLQDSQDPQDMAGRMLAHKARAKARLPLAYQSTALAIGLSIHGLATGLPTLGAPHLLGTFLGVLGVLFVLAKALLPRSGLAPIQATGPRHSRPAYPSH